MAPAVGQDIEALCGKCGQVWHVVMAMMGDRIAKVVCKRCGGHHRYRREGDSGEDAAGGATGAARKSAPTRRFTKATAPRTPAPLPAFDPNKAPILYTAKDSYAVGDRVVHPSFGTGIVTGAVPGQGRIDIAFPAGPRVLACSKTSTKIERPVAVSVPISDRPPQK